MHINNKGCRGQVYRRSVFNPDLLALSIRQPWAWLIVNGFKDVENRKWFTKFRGEFLVHTGKTFDFGAYQRLVQDGTAAEVGMPGPGDYDLGGIVGKARMVACVSRMNSSWFAGPYGFVLEGAERVDFVPCKGRLGFFVPVSKGGV